MNTFFLIIKKYFENNMIHSLQNLDSLQKIIFFMFSKQKR